MRDVERHFSLPIWNSNENQSRSSFVHRQIDFIDPHFRPRLEHRSDSFSCFHRPVYYPNASILEREGDRVTGVTFIDMLKLFEDDPETEAVVMVGEIGGALEEEAADYIKGEMTKPVLAFIAGRNAPPGKSLGHAGAIIEHGRGSAQSKITSLQSAGVRVMNRPMQVVEAVRSMLC